MESQFIEVIKRLLGLVWFALGVAVLIVGLFGSGALGFGPEIFKGSIERIGSGNQADLIFGWILLVILTPIIVGSLMLFSWLSITGEYAKE